ncbi:MAG: hypothetical protein ACI8TQ_003908, partial [Planctomycetota bacterium]
MVAGVAGVKRSRVGEAVLGLLVNGVGSIVRAWEFAGEKLHRGAHD